MTIQPIGGAPVPPDDDVDVVDDDEGPDFVDALPDDPDPEVA